MWATKGPSGLAQGISIIATGLLMICATVLFDILKDKRFIEMQSIIKDAEIPVIRGKFGATHTISVWDLVVGDILLLNPGDRVPADCMVVESDNLEVEQNFEVPSFNENEKMGIEKRRVRKQAFNPKNASADPFLESESFVLAGSAKVVVCNVGPQSYQFSEKNQEKFGLNDDTPLQIKLKNLTTHFSKWAIISCVILLIAYCTMSIISMSAGEASAASVFFAKFPLIANWIIIMWLCSVPEGLALTLGICLAFSVKKMYRDGILIRNLSSPEVLGTIEEIVCGKTGTLTTAKMRVY